MTCAETRRAVPGRTAASENNYLTSTNNSEVPPPNQAAIAEHFRPLLSYGGVVLCSYGENPLTGETLLPKIALITDADSGAAKAAEWTMEPHRNVYVGAATYRVPPPPGKRGGKADIEAVRHLVADFDDLDATRWAFRIPSCCPSWVLETSPGRYQVGFAFSRPVPVEEAEPIARALKAHCRCDHGTADVDHVWRLPGTLNWPNRKKHLEGRPLVPTLVRAVLPWTGAVHDPAALSTLMPIPVPPPPVVVALTSGPRADWAGPTDDDELFQRILASSKSMAVSLGVRCPVDRLFPGDPAVLEEFFENDRSTLDAAVFQHLAFYTGNDQQRMERMARRTIWHRDKWDRPDYLPRTIGKACSLQVEVFNCRGKSPVVIDHGTGQIVSPSDLMWLNRAQQSSTGAVQPNLANVALGLREDTALSGAFTYDEMARTVILTRPIFRQDGTLATIGATPRQVTDTDIDALTEWLQLAGINRLAVETVHHAVDMVGRQNGFHPVRDYLNRLPWDGTPRVDRWLSRYAGAPDRPYERAVGRMFLIGMVARIAHPGAKMDHTLILEGKQGVGKSTLCKILAGERYFTDNLPDITKKAADASMHLRGKWLVELAELDAMSRAEATALKAFMTRTTEKYRPSYGRRDVEEQRQCVFVGTTNEPQYLKDATGNRRFWPVATGRLDLDALAGDRDQLFAEAVMLYRAGAPWWPDREFEAAHIAPEQAERLDVDPWLEKISAWLVGHHGPITLDTVARLCLGLNTETYRRREQNQIRAVMQSLGYTMQRGTGGAHLWHRSGQ